MEAMQQHTIETLAALEATHPDAAARGHPQPHEGPVEGGACCWRCLGGGVGCIGGVLSGYGCL